MKNRNETRAWSAEAGAATRKALATLSILPTATGQIAFKHVDGGFALMAEEDLLAGRLALADRRSGAVTAFAGVDALVASGWVLD